MKKIDNGEDSMKNLLNSKMLGKLTTLKMFLLQQQKSRDKKRSRDFKLFKQLFKRNKTE